MADVERAAVEKKYYASEQNNSASTVTTAEDTIDSPVDNDNESGIGVSTQKPDVTKGPQVHRVPQSSYDPKTAGLPQEIANPKQYARDHKITESQVPQPSNSNDGDPFGAENDVGAQFVGGTCNFYFKRIQQQYSHVLSPNDDQLIVLRVQRVGVYMCVCGCMLMW